MTDDSYSHDEQWEMYESLLQLAEVEPVGQDVTELLRIIREKQGARG